MSHTYTITTPIYYVNSVPHIGTALTTFASDVTSRYQKMRGGRPFFITGTDENAIKVMEAAKQRGETPQAFVNHIAAEFEKIWSDMHIQYDCFVRTTDPAHREAVYKFFDILKSKDLIYEGIYEGWYDVSTETFYKESELVEGKSPEGNSVQKVQEKNWFFRLSAFEDQILSHIEKNPSFIQPEVRRNEVISFIKQGLRDVSISRTNQGWGIPIPGETERVFYVWFEALISYLTGCGWPKSDWEERWPAAVQWMGKDILTRFHATLWPAMLMGADLPLPRYLIGHGWMLLGGEKISKSKGNVIAPLDLAKELQQVSGCELDIAVDAVRHYMGTSMPYEHDAIYTRQDFERHYNADLANDLGNALNRTLAMCHKFVSGQVPDAPIEQTAQEMIRVAKSEFEDAMKHFRIDHAVDAYMKLIRGLNKYIDQRAPWSLAKNQDSALGSVIRSMLLMVRTAEGLITPVQPKTAKAISDQFLLGAVREWESVGTLETMPTGHQLGEPSPIFPRIDVKKAVEPPIERLKDQPGEEEAIDIELLSKIKLRVARIEQAEELEESKKLIKLQVTFGEEKRQIIAGIKEAYSAQDLIGKQVIVVANLKPAKLRGHMSYGMLLAAEGSGGEIVLLTPDRSVSDGASVR